MGSKANPSTVPPGWFCSQLDADEVHGGLAAAAEFLSGEQWDPALIREAIDRLSEEERLRGEVAQIAQKPDEQTQLDSVGRLREVGPELSAALLSGPDDLRRRILTRLVKSVTYLRENQNIEVVLVLPPSRRPAQVCSRGRPIGSEGSRWARPR